jgi:hypothetical protein
VLTISEQDKHLKRKRETKSEKKIKEKKRKKKNFRVTMKFQS